MKGVSAFLAAVLIISIVLVVAIIFSTWTTGLFKTETVKTENRTSCQGSDLSIEGVYIEEILASIQKQYKMPLY